jgi:hypothetical protein
VDYFGGTLTLQLTNVKEAVEEDVKGARVNFADEICAQRLRIRCTDQLCELRTRPADRVCGLALRLYNLHADDLGAVEAIDVLDHAIENHFAVEIANYLMDMHRDSAVGEGFETLRRDDGVNHVPLARPVFADALMAADSSAFHAVGPIHIGMKEEQQKIEIALVEGVVGRLD